MTTRPLLALFTLASAFALAPSASAQFGREQIAKPDADELYADRAVKKGWFDDAVERYSAACNDVSRQKAVWARNCRKLADIYRKGQAGPQDYEKAEGLYDRACFTGKDADACMQQGHISFKGNDGDVDYPYARRLYKQACDLGDQTGCAGYGSMLYRGQGGAMQRTEGKRYIQEACASGDDWACDRATGFGLPTRRGL
ncbi:MAG: tetratricopeptide repeat protein [Henriciella sp.]|uniref:tetratricopeptide repeat protein n=1 Tax=Henriciella sp. TaxID=1968823 RepID=UPI003C746A1C